MRAAGDVAISATGMEKPCNVLKAKPEFEVKLDSTGEKWRTPRTEPYTKPCQGAGVPSEMPYVAACNA